MKTAAIVAALLLTGGALYLVLGSSGSESTTAAASDRTDDDPPARGKRPRARGGSDHSDDDDELVRGEGTLEERVARLEREVATLRRAASIRGRVEVSSGSAPGSIVDDPVLEQEVRGIVEQEREREREREQELRRERFEEFRTAALDELVKVAALSDEQRESIDGLWNTESERMMPLFESMRAGDRSFTEIRDEMRTIRQETDAAARALLSDTQFASYEELRPRGGRGGGPGGGGGRWGGPGGGDGGPREGGRNEG